MDLRPLPSDSAKRRWRYGWIAPTNGVVGQGRVLFRAVVDADLEGIVAKRLADATSRNSPGGTRSSLHIDIISFF
jgi:hypothetical protein